MAGEKKKVKNKQNFIPLKKSTLHQINYTQQIASPIYTTLDVKNMNRSIELKKQVTNKKSISRKSGCISAKPVCSSVKATGTNAPVVKYKQLLKKFDQLKGIQQRVERSKSKSMKQIREKQKSRSPKMKYSNSKKFNLTQLINKHPGTKIHYYTTTNHKTEFNSRMSLTNKLQKTLTKINQNEYFDKDSDSSLIPFISTSQAYNNEQSQTILNSRCFQMSVQEMDDQDINIGEMRKFCRTLENQQLFQSSIKRDIGYFRGDRYEMMATRIQRAWRRYCTKRLVDRYADTFLGQFKDRSASKKSYVLSQDRINSSSSSLKYYEQKYTQAKNQHQRKKIKQEQQDSYGIIYRVDHQLQSSQDGEINDRTFSEQQQSQRNSNFSQNQGNENILDSSLLYPENQEIGQGRLVTYISNFDDNEQEPQEVQKVQFKTIQHSSDQQQKSQSDRQHEEQNEKINKNQQQQIYLYSHSISKSPSNNEKSQTQTDFIMNQVKQNQLNKWKQVVQLLQENKNKQSQTQKEMFLSRLQEKSSKNKRQLQSFQHKIHGMSPGMKKNQQQRPQKKFPALQSNNQLNVPKRQSSGPSSQISDVKKQEQFDSRKYIEYLDSDMYYEFDKDKSSENSQPISKEAILNNRISFKKQKQLLTMLDISQPPLLKRKIYGHTVSKSQNLTYFRNEYEKSQKFPSHPVITKHRLVKSMSEKNIEVVMKSISPQLQYSNEPDELNLQLIRQQFLESGDTVMEFQKLHTSQQLRMKIKETLKNNQRLLNSSSQQDEEPTQPLIRVSLDLSKTFGLNRDRAEGFNQQTEQSKQIKNLPTTKNNEPTAFQLSRQASIYTKQLHPKINLQPQHQPKSTIMVENIDKSISSQQDENHEKVETQVQRKQKMENVSFMIYNTMILQVLRQIASYDSVLERFKDYSHTVKQAIKQGKKGFQTNHTQVKSYVDGLITYLLNQEPQVFKNLQVPAGPTALEMLHYMHPNEQDDMDQGSSVSQDETSVLVIPNRIFDKFWNLRQKSLKYDIESAPMINPQRKKKIVQQLKNLTKMFYRSIFDTFNECLDIERNFGQAGKPYPWKKTPMFPHTKTLAQIQKSIGNAQKRMTQIGTTYCGLIIQKSEMARISLQGSDDYIQHVQQDRMSRMLAQDLIEGEQRWTFYDDQQLQLLVQIGNFIVISLIVEATADVCQILQKDN